MSVPRLVLFSVLCFLEACSKPAGDNAIVVPANATVDVVGTDYAFSMPDSLPAGHATFRFVNKGQKRHEFNIVLLRPEATLQQFITAANADQKLAPFIDGTVGVLFADPGQQSGGTLSTDLLPGRTYAVQCIFKDSGATASHRKMGMFKSVSVKTAESRAVSTANVDTIFGMDYAYRYPSTLTPGLHHVVFVNTGKQRHELAIELLKPGVTVQQVLKVIAANGDLDPLFDPSIGLLHAMGGVTPLGTLDFEVLPGREYMIACEFSDTPKSPPHMALGMFGSMKGVAP